MIFFSFYVSLQYSKFNLLQMVKMVIKEQNLVNSIVRWIKSIIRSHFLERDQKKKKRVKTFTALYKSFFSAKQV